MTTILLYQMEMVLLKIPILTLNGFKVDKSYLGYEDKSRPEDLFDDRVLEQFEVCQSWLKLCEMTKANNTRRGSYYYKHQVESWSSLYISNGAFIAAAAALGLRVKPCHPHSPNTFLPISEKSIKVMKKTKLERAKVVSRS